MSEFKFSCPHCDQHILVDEGYAGVQINCPACQKLIVVPEAPVAARPPSPPAGLSIQRSAPPAASAPSTSAAPRPSAYRTSTPPAQKSGSGAMKTVLVVTAVIVALAVLGGGGWYGWHLYSQHKAKAEASKGNPAALVPTPTAASTSAAVDVLTKVHEAYTHLASLRAQGNSAMVIDMSAVTAADMNPNMTPAQKKAAAARPARRPAGMPASITNKTEITIKLARPDSYLIEGVSKTAAGRASMTNTTAVWSGGKTNFSLTMMTGAASYKNFTTIPDRKMAFMSLAQSGGLTMAIPELFFDEADDMGKFITDWGQSEDDSLNGQDCYTLTAKMIGQKLKIWVSKASYLILQSQITLGAPVSDADIDAMLTMNTAAAKMTPEQTAQMKAQAKTSAAMMTKIRGTITETYDTIETNNAFTADDFNYPVPRGVRLTASPLNAGAATTASTSTEASQRNACINNLRQIDGAKNQWALENGKKAGDAVTEADIKPYIKLDADGNLPKCPAGGKYTIGKVGENPTCSIPGHVLP